MAFLDATNHDTFGPEDQIEERPFYIVTIVGVFSGIERRSNKTLRLVWAINASGGESPPSTHTSGADTYTLLSTSVDRSYGQPLGHYTAIYRKEGTWAAV
jgi:hypothetical protein